MLNKRKKELATTMSHVSAHSAPQPGMAIGEVKSREFDHAYPMPLLCGCCGLGKLHALIDPF